MIPFNKPYLVGNELSYISDAYRTGHFSGDGKYTHLCSRWLKNYSGASEVLLTHSCTAALEMAAILAQIEVGDEVIMPSFTFVSTANAFVLRGGIPVFIDIKPDTLNIDETQIESAITAKTKALVVVHYAGASCNMDTIMTIARRHKLLVIEDAAQAIGSTYKGAPLGTIGDLGCISFHETKNVSCGEGGALFLNNDTMSERARIIRDKGTNRHQYRKGFVDKYTWVDLGSSYLPNELTAAFLYSQLQNLDSITDARLAIWEKYDEALSPELNGSILGTPSFEAETKHNAHIYHLRFNCKDERDLFIEHMEQRKIQCPFHYVSLHSAPYGKLVGRQNGQLKVTVKTSDTLVRLPLWIGIEQHVETIIDAIQNFRKRAIG